MISLKDNRTALFNLRGTIEALEQIDMLISYYSIDKPGPAYCKFEHVNGSGIYCTQIDRNFIVIALISQREKLKNGLMELGIDA